MFIKSRTRQNITAFCSFIYIRQMAQSTSHEHFYVRFLIDKKKIPKGRKGENDMLNDNYEFLAKNEEQFIETIENYEKSGYWKKIDPINLFVVGTTEIDASKFTDLGDIAAYKDTCENSGLYLSINGNEIPMGMSAMAAYFQRNRIGGQVLREMRKEDLADLLNLTIQYSKGLCLIRFAAGKVRAVLGGDEKDYSIIPQSNLFRGISEKLRASYNTRFLRGSFDHYVSIETFLLFDDEMLKIYNDLVDDTRKAEKMFVTVVTSDTGCSGANIAYGLITKGNKILPLGNQIKCEHNKSHTVDDVLNNVNMLFGTYKDAMDDFKKLETIEINHPNECIKNIMHRCGIGKKHITGIIDYRNAFLGPDAEKKTTAKELYFDICQCLDYSVTKKQSQMIDLQERVSRCIGLDWTEFDVI